MMNYTENNGVNMKCIAKITDKEILGTDGLSVSVPRITARAILKNRNDLFAVMYSKKYNLYSLPGGGVEEGENIHTAIQREIWEETGCGITSMQLLGYVEENRAHCDYTQIDYYFVLETNDHDLKPHLTENEAKNKTTVMWLNAHEMYHHIAAPEHDTKQRKFLQARDIAALDYYFSIISKE